jgi:hypothetical protein
MKPATANYGIIFADAILEIHIAWRDGRRLFCHGGFGVRCAERSSLMQVKGKTK